MPPNVNLHELLLKSSSQKALIFQAIDDVFVATNDKYYTQQTPNQFISISRRKKLSFSLQH